jgi:hypothetical protein
VTLKVKDAMLQDQAAEIAHLKQRLEEQDLDARQLALSLEDAEARLEDAVTNANSLEDRLSAQQYEVEKTMELWELLRDFDRDLYGVLFAGVNAAALHGAGGSGVRDSADSLRRENGVADSLTLSAERGGGSVGVSISVAAIRETLAEYKQELER